MIINKCKKGIYVEKVFEDQPSNCNLYTVYF